MRSLKPRSTRVCLKDKLPLSIWSLFSVSMRKVTIFLPPPSTSRIIILLIKMFKTCLGGSVGCLILAQVLILRVMSSSPGLLLKKKKVYLLYSGSPVPLQSTHTWKPSLKNKTLSDVFWKALKASEQLNPSTLSHFQTSVCYEFPSVIIRFLICEPVKLLLPPLVLLLEHVYFYFLLFCCKTSKQYNSEFILLVI